MINVILGPVALSVGGGYWIGVASGNRYCDKRCRKPETAIKDAIRLDKKEE